MSYLPLEQLQQLLFSLTEPQKCAIIELVKAMALDKENKTPHQLMMDARDLINPTIGRDYKFNLELHNLYLKKYNKIKYGKN